MIANSTHDGETPYQWAVNMARAYPTMRAITIVGGIHGTFGLSQSDCVDAAIGDFLVSATPPAIDEPRVPTRLQCPRPEHCCAYETVTSNWVPRCGGSCAAPGRLLHHAHAGQDHDQLRGSRDPDTFVRHYVNVHVPLVQALPGLRAFEYGRALTNFDGSQPDVFWSISMTSTMKPPCTQRSTARKARRRWPTCRTTRAGSMKSVVSEVQ